MDLLMNFADAIPGDRDELFVSPVLEEDHRDQVLKLSNQVVALTARISELSGEKLKVEYENRDLRTKAAPSAIELSAVKEENVFLKSQLQNLWGEVENVSKQKSELFKDRCETSRRLTDEVALLKSELSAEQHKAALAESEKERFRQQVATQTAEFKAKEEAVRTQQTALEDKLARQDQLLSVFGKQGAVSTQLQERLVTVESQLKESRLECIDAQNSRMALQEQLEVLKTEKEALLSQLVTGKENKKAHTSLDSLLGQGWSFSDLVESLSAAKKDVIRKREEIAGLQRVVDEMETKMPSVEATYVALARAEQKLADLGDHNEQLKLEFERREDAIDQLRFEKDKLETSLASAKLRSAEIGKSLASVMHENESLRNRAGLHAGSARSHPALVSHKPARVSVTPSEEVSVPHFRTVNDLVSQNMELKDQVDRLLNQVETESQLAVAKLQANATKLETENKEVLAKLDTQRNEHDRAISRLESELKRTRDDNEKLRNSLVGEPVGGDDIKSQQLAFTKEEFRKQIALKQQEVDQQTRVTDKLAGDLDKVRFELNRNIEERLYYAQQVERLRAENVSLGESHSQLRSRVTGIEQERDDLSQKHESAQLRLTQAEGRLAEVTQHAKTIEARLGEAQRAYQQLASEKELQASELVGYRERLEQESRVFQSNSEALKKLYTDESGKNASTLNFYQAAYEEQVKRGNELTVLIAELRSEKQNIAAELDHVKHRLRQKEEAVVVPSVSVEEMQAVSDELVLAKAALAAAELNAEELRHQAQTSQETISQLRTEMDVVLAEKAAVTAQLVERDQAAASAMETVDDSDRAELNGRLVVLEQQLVDVSSQLDSAKSQLQEANSCVQDKDARFTAAEKRAAELQEQLHRERLLVSVKDSSLVDQLNVVKTKLDAAEREKAVSDEQISALKKDNEKYLSYFANDLSAPEKEEKRRELMEQLQSSLAVHAQRETQLLADLTRSRATLDVLLHENQSLKSIVAERDALLSERAAVSSKLADAEQMRADNEKLVSELHVAMEKLGRAEHASAELRTLQEKIVKLESEYAAAKRDSDEYKRLHHELSVQLSSSTNSGELEQTIAQLEKAKSQLTQTVSKLREEATSKTTEISGLVEKAHRSETELKHVQELLNAKEKESARQDGLMKLKDRKIEQLESTVAVPAASDQLKPLMELINEYQAAFAALAKPEATPLSPASLKRRGSHREQQVKPAGDEPVEPESGPIKKQRHDVQEESIMSDEPSQ